MWALIFFAIGRSVVPQYAEIYPSKEACYAKVPDQSLFSGNQRAMCVPVSGPIPKM